MSRSFLCSARLTEAVDIGVAPLFEREQDRFNTAAKRRQAILHLWRNLCIDFAFYEAVFFQLSQLVGQHTLRNARYLAPKFIEPQRSIQKMKQHNTLPFTVDKADGSFNCTAGTAIKAGMLGFGH